VVHHPPPPQARRKRPQDLKENEKTNSTAQRPAEPQPQVFGVRRQGRFVPQALNLVPGDFNQNAHPNLNAAAEKPQTTFFKQQQKEMARLHRLAT